MRDLTATDLPLWGILPSIHLALDEFLLFDRKLMIVKVASQESTSRLVPIKEACKSLRINYKNFRDASCFTLSLSSNPELDKNFDLPNIVRERSLFELYWPAKSISNFFKRRNKLYCVYERKYKSAPSITYGGLTEWIYVIRGSLTVTVIEPTEFNRIRFENLDEEEELVPDPKTVQRIELKDRQFLYIPAGFISVREANKTTFAMGGEMLHTDDISNQLEAFNKDVTRAYGRRIEEDSEIRHMFWFYGIHSKETDLMGTESLINHLSEWQRLRRLTAEKNTLPPSAYAPLSIQTVLVLKELRKSLKGIKNTVHALVTQPRINA